MLIRYKKGQVVELDLFMAIIIFGFILVIIFLAWNTYSQKINRELDYNTNLIKSYHISDLLTKYPGRPSSWEQNILLGETQIDTIGLSSKDRIIDDNKLSTFLTLDYNFTKDVMNINSYEYYFKISKIDGTDFDSSLEKGIKTDDESTIALRRYVIYNETAAIMEFWLQK